MFWLWLVLIQIFIFAVLIVFLRIVLTQNVSSATEHLHELNQDYNEKVEAANKKKNEVDQYYNEMLLKAKADAEKQKVSILREAQITQEAVLKDSRRQGEEIISNAHKSQETMLAEMNITIENRALDLAADLAKQVLSEEMNEHLHTLWVKELFKTDFDDIQKLHVPQDVNAVSIQTPFPLKEDQKNTLEKYFEAILGKKAILTEELMPELIAGVRIVLGSLVIDGTLKFKIKEAARDAKRV